MDAGPESPPPKRRRLASARTVLRPASELRVSLERLYARLQTEPRAADDGAGDLAGDESALGPELVIVHVHGARSQRSFRCIRSILASGSRPLSAMLYGSDGMCMLETQGSAIRLRDVEPGTFELLLLYLHGKAVQLDEADATALYMLADFYDIASLREACCEMLETCIRPSTVCRWLDLARELNCARLADRCIKMLQAELILIEATEPQFRAIREEDIVQALGSSAIVCRGERDVWEVAQRWAAGKPNHAALLERLVAHIRWPLMERSALERLEHSRSSRSLACLQPYVTEALAYQNATAEERKEGFQLGDRLLARQYLLGELVVMNQQGSEKEESRPLKPDDAVSVGRSRRSDIIIPNPFVSSTHCLIFIEEATVEGGVRELQVKLRDVSSNGAYVNNELVGKDKVVSLKHGDRISMVRPQDLAANPPADGAIGYILFRQLGPARGVEAGGGKGGASTQETDGGETTARPAGVEEEPFEALTPEE